MKKIYLLLTSILSFGLQAQIISFPDQVFKAKLLEADINNNIAAIDDFNYIKIDANNNGEIEFTEAENVIRLNVNNSGISDLTGIKSFVNLQNCSFSNNNISNLDLSDMPELLEISETNNPYVTIDLSGLTLASSLGFLDVPTLTSVDLSNASITSVIFSTVPLLTNLNVTNSHFESFNLFNSAVNNDLVFQNGNMYSLHIVESPVGSITISNVGPSVAVFFEHLPQLSYLSMSGPIDLLSISDTPLLPNLDLTNCQVEQIQFAQPFVSIFAKNGFADPQFAIDSGQLQYICADDFEVESLQSYFSTWGVSNVEINSYCSFTPGGEYYTVQGNARLDLDNDGCDNSDFDFPQLKLSIVGNQQLIAGIADNSGHYEVNVQAGSYMISPQFENPDYFNVSPTSIVANFPTQVSPVVQDFCIAPNGTHHDLEVVLIPIGMAIAGFDVSYRLIYKNKGNQVESGTVSVAFNDLVLDFLTANPVAVQSANVLSWTYSNLAPFESREVIITLNTNAPSDTPPLNSGDVLEYTSVISGSSSDETPFDNTAETVQSVFNSFDPNDKTCLEGDIVGPETAGQYVHYLIRFENTGTFPAQNIIVKDMIDESKFDINTLIPFSSSDSYTTRIAGSKVEFIFENINLPFDDDNNDGYVAFKIKTKPTLVAGDILTNAASIYFDYNLPVITEPAITTITALSTPDFAFSDYFTLYPVPAKNELNIRASDAIEIKSITICNVLGQLVIAIPNAQTVESIDTSSLENGNYFLKINSDKGTTNARFVKN